LLLLMCCITFIVAYLKSSLHPWDKADFVMVNDLFDMLLNLVCHYFIEDFLHLCSWRRLTCSSPFLDVSLSGFGMSVILVS
jgi:hypothetical protein